MGIEVIEEDGELIGVEVRNTKFMKFNGLTWEEVQDTFEVIRKLFDRQGYLYLREANKLFKKMIDDKEKALLEAENSELKQKLEEKSGVMAPKTLGRK